MATKIKSNSKKRAVKRASHTSKTKYKRSAKRPAISQHDAKHSAVTKEIIGKQEAKFYGIGRRKSSAARVMMVPGTGKVLINGRTPQEYFPNAIVVQDMMQPLTIVGKETSFDIYVRVEGGGFTGQAGATRLGIARALVLVSEEHKNPLKKQKMVTRDRRAKERKKVGKYGARRSPQFTKR
jgi:small subunit ribosomal protein S9